MRITRLPAAGVNNQEPEFTPDGTGISFIAARNPFSLLLIPADGGGAAQSVLVSDQRVWHFSWSADGAFLAFGGEMAGSDYDIWSMRTDDGSEPVLILDSEFDEQNPQFSPDGAWLA